MNRFFFISFLMANISFAQTDEKFLSDFLLEDELQISNAIDKYNRFDFSNVWLKTENHLIYGIIGNEHQRIRIKLISIEKKPGNPNEYIVFGKSEVRNNICDFNGVVQIVEIREVKELHFGVDDEYKNEGIKSQGILIANYEFKENKEQAHSGVFKGRLYSKWYLDSENQIKYDDIQSISDGYSNNAFIGIWKSHQTGKEKICNWADYRVPKANLDFDIGTGEFSVSKKYRDKGWQNITLKHRVSEKRKSKEWWE